MFPVSLFGELLFLSLTKPPLFILSLTKCPVHDCKNISLQCKKKLCSHFQWIYMGNFLLSHNLVLIMASVLIYELLRWLSGKESAWQSRRRKRFEFNPWVRKNPLEKEVATHSSVLAWRTPWTEEPGGPQSIGLQRVGHALATEQAHSTYNLK